MRIHKLKCEGMFFHVQFNTWRQSIDLSHLCIRDIIKDTKCKHWYISSDRHIETLHHTHIATHRHEQLHWKRQQFYYKRTKLNSHPFQYCVCCRIFKPKKWTRSRWIIGILKDSMTAISSLKSFSSRQAGK